MVSAGAINIFSRSIENFNIINDRYLGDGDSSSYKEVIDSQPFKSYNITPEKLECVGHAQKRMGSRLRSIIQSYKSTKTPIHGKLLRYLQ